MKRMTLIISLLGFLLLPGLAGSAQAARHVAYVGDNLWLGSYNVSIPLSDTKDYIGQTSWLGFTVEARHFLKPNATVGLLTGWTTIYNKSYRVSQTGSTTVSGVQARYLNIFPLLANGYFYFGDRDTPSFYLGGGVGTYWIERRTEVGLYAFTENDWHFGVAPEIGIAFPHGRTSIVLSARYNHAFAAGSVNQQSWLSLGLGFQLN